MNLKLNFFMYDDES